MARNKPSPFDVEKVTQSYFQSWTAFLLQRYRRICPFPSRPLRELKIVKEHPRLILHRDSYTGNWESSVVIDAKFKLMGKQKLKEGEFQLPDSLYKGKKSSPF